MRKETEKLFDKFCQGLKRNDYTSLKDDFCQNAIIEHSMTGNGMGYDDFISLFTYSGIGSTCVKTNIENTLFRENATQAAYSFHLLKQFCNWDQHKFMHYLHYGATVILKILKIENHWKISQVIFELAWIDGNTNWVKNQNLIDYTCPRKHPKLIQAKEDGVVNIIQLEEDNRTDIEKITEVLFIYGWFVDYEDYDAFEKVADQNLKIIDGFHNQVIQSRAEWISFVKSLHLKESFLHHTYHIQSYDVQEQHAFVKMSRVEPNRIGSKVINTTNYRKDWFTMDLNMILHKENNQWILKQAELIKNIRPVDSNGFLYKESSV